MKISFKGTKSGLILEFDGNVNYSDFEAYMEKSLSSNPSMLSGGVVAGIRGSQPDFSDKMRIFGLLTEKYNMKVKSLDPIIQTAIVEKEIEVIRETVISTKVYRHTIRSGTLIEHDADILVLGDVNPGAELVSTGNIVIFGSLRGIANAGVRGNREAVVIANDFRPSLIRIANLIARAPDGGYKSGNGTEIAYIKDGSIFIDNKIR